MTVCSRHSLRALVAFGLLVTGMVTVVSLPTAATTEKPCEVLREWASAYRDASPSLDEVARFDRGQRVAIFNAVAPEMRAALWREQLQRFDNSDGLSASQHALLAEAIALVTPALYAGDRQAKAASDAFWVRATKAFSLPHERRAIADLGAMSSAYRAAPAASAECNCSSTTAVFDCMGGQCLGPGSCAFVRGCGPSGTGPCDGTCQ